MKIKFQTKAQNLGNVHVLELFAMGVCFIVVLNAKSEKVLMGSLGAFRN